MKTEHHYITLATPGSKKIAVCGRRIGSRDRMTVIATCTEETVAERIVDALNLLQKKIEQLEAPAQKILIEVRERLSSEAIRANTAIAAQRELQRRFDNLRSQFELTQRELERERNVAREKLKEST